MDEGDGRIAQDRHRGVARVGWIFALTATAYNLCVCPSYWARRHSHARIALQYRAPGQTRVREAFQCSNLYNHSMYLCYVV